MRLLVIEDDAILRESLATKLGESGFAVEQAADGKEGLYFALEYPIDPFHSRISLILLCNT